LSSHFLVFDANLCTAYPVIGVTQEVPEALLFVKSDASVTYAIRPGFDPLSQYEINAFSTASLAGARHFPWQGVVGKLDKASGKIRQTHNSRAGD